MPGADRSVRIFILLPAYNERVALGELIPGIASALRPLGLDFIIGVIDDGSRDGTPELLETLSRDFPVHSLVHQENQGYGAALRTGFLWVVKNALPTDIAVTMDADNTHLPQYIPPMIAKIKEGFDVVMASYARPGGQTRGVPLARRLLSWGVNRLLRFRFPMPGLLSYTNGFRAYRTGILQKTFQAYGEGLIAEAGFCGGTELLVRMAKLRPRCAEIPFTLHYENRGSQSKINIPKTIAGYARLLRNAGDSPPASRHLR